MVSIRRQLCVLLALLTGSTAAAAQEVTVRDDLAGAGSAVVQGTHVRTYAVDSRPSSQLRSVTVSSDEFDAYLVVVDPAGQVVSDDDSGGGNTARLRMSPARTGEWLIVITSSRRAGSGRFVLSVDGPRPRLATGRRLPRAAMDLLTPGALASPARVDTVTVVKTDTVYVRRTDTITVRKTDTVTRVPGQPVRSGPRTP